jgi:hypothetical protein
MCRINEKECHKNIMHLVHNSKTAVVKVGGLAARLVKLAARKRPLLWPVWQTLPVAGLDGPAAQAVLYSLRQGLGGLQDDQVR